MKSRINVPSLILQLAIPLGVGLLSALLTNGKMELYASLNQPKFAPPAILFPIVWTLLYLMMGTAAYLIAQSTSPNRKPALAVYYLQLLFNFFWTLLFFLWQWYLAAFVWLLLLIILILAVIVLAAPASKAAAWLLVPYLLWTIFAGYLNLGIYLLNRS